MTDNGQSITEPPKVLTDADVEAVIADLRKVIEAKNSPFAHRCIAAIELLRRQRDGWHAAAKNRCYLDDQNMRQLLATIFKDIGGAIERSK